MGRLTTHLKLSAKGNETEGASTLSARWENALKVCAIDGLLCEGND